MTSTAGFSSDAQVILSFFQDRFRTTGKRGVYASREELAEMVGLGPISLTSALRELDNAGFMAVYSRSRYGTPYVHLTDVGVSISTTASTTTTITTTAVHTPNDAHVVSTPGPQGGATQLPAPRVHYLEAVAEVRDVFPHQDLDFQDGTARVEVTFGQYRRKVTLKISMNKPGLAPAELRHALGKAWTLIEQKLGRRVAMEEFTVVSLHLNQDFLGLRLDGGKSVTLSDADTWLRLYEKGGVLRSEAVLSGGVVTLDKALALMATSYADRTMLLEMHSDVKQILLILQDRQKKGDQHATPVVTSVGTSYLLPKIRVKMTSFLKRKAGTDVRVPEEAKGQA